MRTQGTEATDTPEPGPQRRSGLPFLGGVHLVGKGGREGCLDWEDRVVGLVWQICEEVRTQVLWGNEFGLH